MNCSINPDSNWKALGGQLYVYAAPEVQFCGRGPGGTIQNPTLVRRMHSPMHINELTTGLCIIKSVHVTIIILGKTSVYVTLRVEISHMFQNKKIQFLIECYRALF